MAKTPTTFQPWNGRDHATTPLDDLAEQYARSPPGPAANLTFERIHADLAPLIRRIASDLDIAGHSTDDLLAEASIALLAGLRRYDRSIGSAKALAVIIVQRRFVDLCRRATAAKRRAPNRRRCSPDSPPSREADPLDALAEVDALVSITQQAAAILIGRDLDIFHRLAVGQSTAEIAIAFNWPAKRVRARRAAIRKKLTDNGLSRTRFAK